MENKRTKLISVLLIVLCLSLCVGATYAYFTDSVTSSNNIIKTGTLDVTMEWANGTTDPANTSWTDASTGAIFNYDLWEPGYTDVRHIRIKNVGTLAFQYKLVIVANGEVTELADVIDVYYFDPAIQVADRTALANATPLSNLTAALAGMDQTANGTLLAGESVTVTIALKMQEDAGNNYQNKSIGSDFSIQLYATQYTYESDAFDNQYDCLHAETEVIAGEDATCSEAGLTEGKKCKICEEVVLEQEEIGTLPHTPGTWVVEQDPKYNQIGIKNTQCTVCGAAMQETMTYQRIKEFTFKLSADRTYYSVTVNSSYLNGEFDDPITIKDIVIPATYFGVPVKECSVSLDYDSYLQTITIPPSIEKFSMGRKDGVILYITDLEAWMNADFANRVPDDYMGYEYYDICLLDENGNQVKDLILPAGMTTIEDGMFCNFSISSIQIPSTVTSIGDYAFFGTNLQSITIPTGVTSIGDYAFAETCLQSIIIPESVTSMGEHVITKQDSEITIFCEVEEKPDGWKSNWNFEYYTYDEFPVIWGSTGEEYTYTFESNQGTSFESITSSVKIELPVPTREEFDFAGWYDNEEFTGSPVTSPYYSATKHTLYAKWTPEKAGASLKNPIIMEQEVAYTVDVTKEGQWVYFSFTPETSGNYAFAVTSRAPIAGDLYDSSNTKDALEYYRNWMSEDCYISHDLTAGSTYYLTVRLYDDEYSEYYTGSVTVTVTAE